MQPTAVVVIVLFDTNTKFNILQDPSFLNFYKEAQRPSW